MLKAYICSSNLDRDYVLPAVTALEAAGFSCCVPGRDFNFDGNWGQSATDAINQATVILYFESDNSKRSFRLYQELNEAKESGLLKLVFEVGSFTPEDIVSAVKEKTAEAEEIKANVSTIFPYSGDQPYIFASYSHLDMDKVFAIIRLLQKRGYRVWFDEGIDPGTEWEDNIAGHLAGAGYVIPFFSENYFSSQNCNDELFFARELGLHILPVYLEDLELEPGIAMRFGRLQALFYHKYKDKSVFLEKIDTAQDIKTCHD